MDDGWPVQWLPGALVTTLALFGYVVMNGLATGWLLIQRRRLQRAVSHSPAVTILKPLRGVDEGLEENLRSFAALDYPALQIIFCAADPHDPALAIAQRVVEAHPNRNLLVMAGAEGSAINPKVLLLEHMLPQATGEILYISDSNVRARSHDLYDLVAPLSDPRVGLVYQPVVGIEEQTLPAAMENLLLGEQSGAGMIAVKALVRFDAVMGKGILLRREALTSIGGLTALRDVLAEDYILGVMVKRAGWRLALSPVPALAVHRQWSLDAVVGRHLRHASMRCRLCPWTYHIELLLNPVAWSTILLLFGGWQGALAFAATLTIKTGLAATFVRLLRGSWPQARHLCAMPITDMLSVGLWVAGIFNSTVQWRGTRYRIQMGTRLIRLEPVPTAATVTASETQRRAA